MLKAAILGMMMSGLAVTAAAAACPPVAAGNTAEQIEANGRRLVCLQNELARDARQRHDALELQQLTRSLDSLRIERRFDALATAPAYAPPLR